MPPVNIPDGLQDPHFGPVKGLLQRILNELKAAGAKRVVTRVNRSDKDIASPVFVGVVEDADIIVQRRRDRVPDGDVGKLRFKDDNQSKVYNDTVNDPTGAIVVRHWNGDKPPRIPGANPRGMGKIAGCVHQRFIAMRIRDGAQHRHVGTLTVGFIEPPDMATVGPIMKKWAQDEQNSDLIKHLKAAFNLNGPRF
jgi:hypothetical protein